MTLILITFVVFSVAMLAMAVGLLRGRRLRGSCGGSAGACDCTEAATCPRVKSFKP
ncbi:MAG: Na(+)-translocating NADH-quinone reductase subunit E [Myxococcus sp.]|nr:Na(+)-translocating NADH-quinone reductase subunit E [Myxococcus sp.]